LKKVVIREKEETVAIDDLRENYIYAAYVEGEGHILFICSVNDKCMPFETQVLYADGSVNHFYRGKSLDDITTKIIEDGLEVYQFEDEFDFANWLVGIYSE
jgi:hypothetical protein